MEPDEVRESQVGMGPKSAKKLRGAWMDAPFHTGRSSPSHPHDQLNLRLSRAISWLDRAEQETRKEPPDSDAAFIFHWMAFDAMSSQLGDTETDRWRRQYFKRMVAFADAESAIYGAIWSVLRDDISRILKNRYVFQPYWDHRNDQSKWQNWKQEFDREQQKVEQALRETRTLDVLIKLFRRLNTLRNQLLHGGATWKSSMNRNQVTTGARVMASLVPRFIDVMIQHPDGLDGWGDARYLVVREREEQSGWTDDA